jgi:hypothetical protein
MRPRTTYLSCAVNGVHHPAASCISILAELAYTPPAILVVLFHDGGAASAPARAFHDDTFAVNHRVIIDDALDYSSEHFDKDCAAAAAAAAADNDDEAPKILPATDGCCDKCSGCNGSKGCLHVLDLSRTPALTSFKLERHHGVFAGCGLSYCTNM